MYVYHSCCSTCTACHNLAIILHYYHYYCCSTGLYCIVLCTSFSKYWQLYTAVLLFSTTACNTDNYYYRAVEVTQASTISSFKLSRDQPSHRSSSRATGMMTTQKKQEHLLYVRVSPHPIPPWKKPSKSSLQSTTSIVLQSYYCIIHDRPNKICCLENKNPRFIQSRKRPINTCEASFFSVIVYHTSSHSIPNSRDTAIIIDITYSSIEYK